MSYHAFYASSNHFRDSNVSHFYLKKVGQGHGVNSIFAMRLFDGKYKKLQKTPIFYSLALNISEILTFQIVYLQKVGQGHEVQFSQWGHSMANIKIYKSRSVYFYVSSNLFRDINVFICYLRNSRSRSQSTIFAMLYFHGEYRNLQTSFLHFGFSRWCDLW